LFLFTNEEVFTARYKLCLETHLRLIHVSEGLMNS